MKLWSMLSLAAAVLALSLPGGAAQAPVGGDISIVSTAGDVQLTVRGVVRKAVSGAVLELPAQIVTGADGKIELRQGPTTAAIAALSKVEIPAGTQPGELIARIVQSKGNVLYKVGKRPANKLHVETPFLVAVVKGTEFNVAAQDSGTIISLFEGLLEVRSSDGADTVDIKAGQVAARNASDAKIRILRLDTGASIREQGGERSMLAAANVADAVAVLESPSEFASVNSGMKMTAFPGSMAVSDTSGEATPAMAVLAAKQGAEPSVATGIDLGATTGIETGMNTTIAGNLNSPTTASPAVSGGIDPGGAGGGTAPAVNLGAGTVSAGIDVGATLGTVAATTTVGASVDLGTGSISTNAGAGADLGVANVAGNVSGAVNVGAGNVSAGAGAGVNLGTGASPVTGVAATVAADTNLGTGSLNTTVGATVGGANVGVSIGLDPETGLTVGIGTGNSGNTDNNGNSGNSGNGNSGNSGSSNGNSGNGNGNSGNGNGNNGVVGAVTGVVTGVTGAVTAPVTGLVGGLLGGRGSLRKK